MVVFDQLRISDDGQSMFINAHVNKASYFDDISISKVTICTEDQVSETNPLAYGDDYIYQVDASSLITDSYEQVFDQIQILSAEHVIESTNTYGGLKIDYQVPGVSTTNAISFILRGQFSILDGEYAPKLIVASEAFNPLRDSIYSSEVFFTVNGEKIEQSGYVNWQFNGKGDMKENTLYNLYIYKQSDKGVFEYVRFDQADDIYFTHYYWQAYVKTTGTSKKEVNLVLNANSFNEKFQKSDLTSNMFFVYIECTGTVKPDTPCRLDELITLGVTFDYGLIYNNAMNYTRELADKCSVPGKFIDFILNVEALKMSVETEHYVPAIQYYYNLLGIKNDITSTTKPCGCYG